MKKRRPARLPRRLRRFFWEYDFGRLSWAADRDLVIARILAVGDWESLRWLRRRVSNDELAQWIVQRRGAGLSNRHLRFFELILDLPHREVNTWLADPARKIWEAR